jgi:thioredoxin reductase (NADPH)
MELLGAHAMGYVNVLEGVEVHEIKVGRQIEALTSRGTFVGRALILATGTDHRKLGVSGEDRFHGKGVSYCATCDGYLYKDGTVLMVGGGNSALTDALYLKNLGADVHIVHRRDEFRAEKALQDSVDREGIPVIRDGVVEEILGADGVEGAKLRNVKSDKEKTFKADAVFVAIGEIPHNRLAKDIGLNLSEEGYIDVDRACRTSIPRVYAAGDITGGVRQIVTAVSEGATAALSAFEDLQTPYWKKEAK